MGGGIVLLKGGVPVSCKKRDHMRPEHFVDVTEGSEVAVNKDEGRPVRARDSSPYHDPPAVTHGTNTIWCKSFMGSSKHSSPTIVSFQLKATFVGKANIVPATKRPALVQLSPVQSCKAAARP